MKKVINAQNIDECISLMFEYIDCKWWQFARIHRLKQRINNQFIHPMQSKPGTVEGREIHITDRRDRRFAR